MVLAISGANLAHAGTVLPPIHLKRPWQGFCVLAAGISAPGGIFLAASTEKVPRTASRWIGGKREVWKTHSFLPEPNHHRQFYSIKFTKSMGDIIDYQGVTILKPTFLFVPCNGKR
jgi:hypothetical protein